LYSERGGTYLKAAGNEPTNTETTQKKSTGEEDFPLSGLCKAINELCKGEKKNIKASNQLLRGASIPLGKKKSTKRDNDRCKLVSEGKVVVLQKKKGLSRRVQTICQEKRKKSLHRSRGRFWKGFCYIILPIRGPWGTEKSREKKPNENEGP